MEKNVGPETEARRQGYRSFGENGQAGKPVRPFSFFWVDIRGALLISPQPSELGCKRGGPTKTESEPFGPIRPQKPTAQYQPRFAFFLSAEKVVPKNDGKEMNRAIARAFVSKK